MIQKQLAALFTFNLALSSMAAVVGALLPIVAGRLGADSALTGFFLSSTAASIAVGNLAAGWLSNKLQRRKTVLIATGLVEIMCLWLIGQAVNMPQLFLFTLATGLLFGIQVTTVGILTGLFAQPSERGRVFGLIASAAALGALIGGLGGGPIVDCWGFPGLFTAAALITIVQPLAALLLEDKAVQRRQPSAATNAGVAVSGLISLPFPYLLGWLSDRIGRKPLLICCYFASTVSLIILAASLVLWHFWLSTALQTLVGASLAVGSALVTDLVPEEALGSALAVFGATSAIGLVIGNAAMGIALQSLGMLPTLIFGAFLALFGIALLIPIRKSKSRYAVAPA